ncbi:MAG: hypothetical protein ACLFR1_14300 [Spirochaetia bacterium]
MKNIRIAFVLLACITVLFSCGQQEPTIEAQEGADLSGASINWLYPLNVLPGTLFLIEGEGFGEVPGEISLGGTAITEFLSWEDRAIFFRIPEDFEEEAQVTVGPAVSEETVSLAPENSITVRWTIDAEAAQETCNTRFAEFGLDNPPEFVFPLFIKGQWTKSGDSFGNYNQGWDTGSRRRMYHLPDSNIWKSECVFTPENIESFGSRAMLFAFEDDNIEDRNLSSYESDAAFILKIDFAESDRFTSVSSDPAVSVSPESPLFHSGSDTVRVEYPVE